MHVTPRPIPRPMFQFTSGSILGRYELLLPIASGGMAEVWAARLHGTRGFTKLVAIKTIRRGVMDDTRLEQMLLVEADLASRIQHPNVVSTLELGEENETLFLVMEWADAEPLNQLMTASAERGGIPLEIGVNIIAQACRGLQAAHELTDDDGAPLGVVHRDISPQNVLVTYSGVVKLVDFGIAKATQRATSMTEDGEVKGKLAFMSPEQVSGKGVDRRTDIFALGTMLYLLTTGQHPFKGTHPGETLAKLFSSAPILPPSRFVPSYPKGLERVVLKAVNKERDSRFATAHEMLLALEEAVPSARGIEAKVGDFLNLVSGSTGDRRRRHIRTAGELLESRPEGFPLVGGTSTSLAAMSLGTTPSGTPATASAGVDPRKRSKSARAWRWFAGAALAAAGVALSFESSFHAPDGMGAAVSTAAGVAPPLTTPGTKVSPSPRLQPAPPTDAAAIADGQRVSDATSGPEVSRPDVARTKTEGRAKPSPVARKKVAPRAPVDLDLKDPGLGDERASPQAGSSVAKRAKKVTQPRKRSPKPRLPKPRRPRESEIFDQRL